jgi:hypothetical protein
MPKLSTRKVSIENRPSHYEPVTMPPGPSIQPEKLPFNRGFINPFFSYDFEVERLTPRGTSFYRTWNIVNSQAQNFFLLLQTSGTTSLK